VSLGELEEVKIEAQNEWSENLCEKIGEAKSIKDKWSAFCHMIASFIIIFNMMKEAIIWQKQKQKQKQKQEGYKKENRKSYSPTRRRYK
jgi:hypothetical protein